MTLQQWSRYSLAAQLANIFVELGRAERFGKSADQVSHEQSIGRALQLTDLTIEAQAGLTRRRELARLREVIADNLLGAKTHHVSLEHIRSMLEPVAFWAARERVVV
jgi:hypothetical protein